MRGIVGLAALAAAGVCAAAEPAAKPAVITNPDWARRPSGEDIARYYPELASNLGVDGLATVSCMVNAQGRLVDCRAVSEAPAGLGFGAAAISLAAVFEMRPMTVNGKPVDGGTVRIPIRFLLPSDPRAGAPPEAASEEDLRQGRRVVDGLGAVDFTMRAYAANRDRVTRADVPEAIRKAAIEAMTLSADSHRDDLRDALARAVMSVYTAKEASDIADAIALAKEPESVAMQPLFLKIRNDYQRRSRLRAHDIFCASRVCTPPATSAARRNPRGVIPDPKWAVSPSPARTEAARPALAAALNLTGTVSLTCGLDDAGVPQGCKTDRETPTGLGYEAAAIQLATKYRLDPAQLGSGAKGRKVALDITFPAPALPDAFRAPAARSEHAADLARQISAANEAQATARRDIEMQILGYQAKPPAGVDAKTYDAALEAVRTAAVENLPDVAAQDVNLMAGTLTDSQLSRLAAFVGSPSATAQRERADALNVAADRAGRYVFGRIVDDVRARFCKDRDCPPPPAQRPPPPAVKPDG